MIQSSEFKNSVRLTVSVLSLSLALVFVWSSPLVTGARYQFQSFFFSFIVRLTTNHVIIPVHLSSLLPFPSPARILELSSALLLPNFSYAKRKRKGNKCMLSKYFLVYFIFTIIFVYVRKCDFFAKVLLINIFSQRLVQKLKVK